MKPLSNPAITDYSLSIPPFYAMEMFREAKQREAAGRPVLHLSLGQPAAALPEHVRMKLAEKIHQDGLGYSDALGLTKLRERICQYYDERYGLNIPLNQMMITTGSSAAYVIALLSAFRAGDAVALSAPYYPASVNMMRAFGLHPQIMPANVSRAYQPHVEGLKALPHPPAGLVLASPANPTGSVIPQAQFKAVADYCRSARVQLISDEIYHGIHYEGADPVCARSLDDEAIILGSFSKYFLLPGWRIGWLILPERLVARAEALLQNMYISPPALAQYAALLMMDEQAALSEAVAGYARNRNFLLQALPAIGWDSLRAPEGAFYMYLHTGQWAEDSHDFCRKLLKDTGVCLVPGIDFDHENGHHYVRLSYAGDLATMQQAVFAMRDWSYR